MGVLGIRKLELWGCGVVNGTVLDVDLQCVSVRTVSVVVSPFFFHSLSSLLELYIVIIIGRGGVDLTLVICDIARLRECWWSWREQFHSSVQF